MSRAALRALAAVVLFALLAPPLRSAPVEVGLDARAVREAVLLGSSRDQARLRAFHAAYRIPVDDPVIRELEIVTEFRRVVQMSEERAGLRDSTWDAARAAAELQPSRGLLSLVVGLQFNPQNAYRAMPAYSVAIYAKGRRAAAIPPVDSSTTPAYVSGQPAPPGTPILAASLRAAFDATRLDPGAEYLAAVFLDGREVRRIPIDLGRIR